MIVKGNQCVYEIMYTVSGGEEQIETSTFIEAMQSAKALSLLHDVDIYADVFMGPDDIVVKQWIYGKHLLSYKKGTVKVLFL